MESDADAMAATVRAEERSATQLTGDDDEDNAGETWQDLWRALALADNDVRDHLGQMHRPPEQLVPMQGEAGGLPPVRSAVWLLYGHNWFGNMMHDKGDMLYRARRGRSMFASPVGD